MEKVLEGWFKFRQEELEVLNGEDKEHLYDFEKYSDVVLNCVECEMYHFIEKQLDKLEGEILDSTEYFNKKYYMAGFMDAVGMILRK